ncbi:hypothetical protein BDV37DRAFT_264240 [Aspergillus pseudonomiae]|uniref:Uncharacterized protein n=1 Tax=Aspergillus pseudonomiae TaxID=1506151 RepID=A0A5N7CV43_9EURO|nr:uncharacterized protein BDV37DRAFT_264240 [Aspergillus pseudonomiae]KAE8398075.1 hypothetical protein BDV37DRAFT_264240 [Aspergillus pseudonomiae]
MKREAQRNGEFKEENGQEAPFLLMSAWESCPRHLFPQAKQKREAQLVLAGGLRLLTKKRRDQQRFVDQDNKLINGEDLTRGKKLNEVRMRFPFSADDREVRWEHNKKTPTVGPHWTGGFILRYRPYGVSLLLSVVSLQTTTSTNTPEVASGYLP